MNITYLEAFLYAVYYNSIQQAADKLFLAQPTVSARIKALERELDVTLFIRQGRGIALTEKGREFVSYAEQIVQTYDRAKKRLRPMQVEMIKIGASREVAEWFIPFALPRWKKAYEDVQFHLVSAQQNELIDQLLRKKLQIALLPKVTHASIQQQFVFNNSLQLVTATNHPFARRRVVQLDELQKQPFVVVESEMAAWNKIGQTLEYEQLTFDTAFVVNHLHVAKALIQNNDAIGFLPKMSVAKELQLEKLSSVEVDADLPLTQSIYATYYGTEEPALWRDMLTTIEQFKLYDWTERQAQRLMHV